MTAVTNVNVNSIWKIEYLLIDNHIKIISSIHRYNTLYLLTNLLTMTVSECGGNVEENMDSPYFVYEFYE